MRSSIKEKGGFAHILSFLMEAQEQNIIQLSVPLHPVEPFIQRLMSLL